MRISRTLFFKWGIRFEEEYAVEEKGNRKVAYAEKQEILDGIVKKYHPEWLMENAPPAEAIPPAGGQAQAMTERNQPSSREKGKGGGTGLRTALEPPDRNVRRRKAYGRTGCSIRQKLWR